MDFNFDNDKPIYIQLLEQLKTAIISGRFQPGERLPSVRELAGMAKVNPNTIQKALSELENDGLIITQRTNGKFVTGNQSLILEEKQNLARKITRKFLRDMEKLGVDLNTAEKYLLEQGGKTNGDA